MSRMKAVVVANGPPPDRTTLMRAIESAELVIAADGGTWALLTYGIKPDLIVGDLDSMCPAALAENGLNGKVIEHPADKEFTDVELAVEEAFSRGADDILLLGSFGGRIDHTLTNLALIVKQPETIKGFTNEGPVRLVAPGVPLKLKLRPGTRISLNAWDGPARHVSASGLKWNLDDDELETGGRGVENEALGDVDISVGDGYIFVTVLSRDPGLIWGNEQMEGFDFGTIAERYDAYYDTPPGHMVDRIEKSAMEKVLPDAKPGQSLLEIGSGTGHWSEWFAGKGYNVTGVDVSPDMVKVATSKRLHRKINGVHYVVGDASRLQFPDNYFDVGAAVTVLEFVDDPGRIVSEMARVVRPGGRLVFGVLHEDSFLGRSRAENPDPVFTPAHFFTEAELTGLLSGFGKVKVNQCLYVDPVPEKVDEADEIEVKGQNEGWKTGNFLVAEVRL